MSQETAASEVRVFLNGGLVACDIVKRGETVFTATVPQFELWKLRAWLREKPEIDTDLRLRAIQRMEAVEAEIWRRVEDANSREVGRMDWLLSAMVTFHLVAVTGLLAWFLAGLWWE